MEKEDHEGHADPEAAALESSSHHSEQQPAAAEESTTTTRPNKGAEKSAEAKNASQTLPLQASDDTRSHSNGSLAKSNPPTPRLIHPSLLRIPMQIRYVVYGTISSALFMVLYNVAVEKVGYLYFPSTIYAVTYMVFIPIQHAMASCMVFGWPQRYFSSLTANVPIGLTAIALGSYLTAYLDKVDFNDTAEQTVRRLGLINTLSPSTAGPEPEKENIDNNNNSNGEFYTSLVVLIVTSFWSWILAVIVNAPAETSDKKQL